MCLGFSRQADWSVATLDITFARSAGSTGMVAALDRVSREAQEAVRQGNTFIILSDRAVDADNVPIPSALAVGAVHQSLLKERTRLKV